MKKIIFPVCATVSLASGFVYAEEQQIDTTGMEEPTWVDEQREDIKDILHDSANTIDGWIGTPDPNTPATAGLRFVLDSEWNRYDKLSVKPRVRGKIRLPALKKHLSVVFGDEDLENEAANKNHSGKLYRRPLGGNKRYDRQQSRNDSASVGLRWSNGIKRLGINTDIDLGVRSGADIFLRFKAEKEWQLNEKVNTRLEQIYRYGSNSKHYLRTNFETKYHETENTFFANHLYLQYEHDHDELITWGNSLYRQHNFVNYKRLNYGVYVGGDLNNKKFSINQYGPFISWRQPVWRDWLFFQPELNYYNNRDKDRKHTVGAFIRLEAIF